MHPVKEIAGRFLSRVGFAAPSHLRVCCCLVTAGTRQGDGSLAISLRNIITAHSTVVTGFGPFSVVKRSAHRATLTRLGNKNGDQSGPELGELTKPRSVGILKAARNLLRSRLKPYKPFSWMQLVAKVAPTASALREAKFYSDLFPLVHAA